MDSKRAEYIRGLYDLAYFLEDHEDVPIPTTDRFDGFVYDRKQIVELALRIGDSKKKYDSIYFSLVKQFGPITLEFSIPRDKVCRRKVVGRRTIPATPEHTIDVVEWECDESILKEDKPVGYPQKEFLKKYPGIDGGDHSDQTRIRAGNYEVAAGSDDLESGVFPDPKRNPQG